eukprot:721960-Alexandrium_andersonii.AAC.1
MSASLVGSEMCIRDSLRGASCAIVHADAESDDGGGCSGGSEGVPRGAVSYTHLTLPTICSV